MFEHGQLKNFPDNGNTLIIFMYIEASMKFKEYYTFTCILLKSQNFTAHKFEVPPNLWIKYLSDKFEMKINIYDFNKYHKLYSE